MKKVLIILSIICLLLTACEKESKTSAKQQTPGADAQVVHEHTEAFEGDNIVEHEFVGYCGNTITKIRDRNGFEAEFWGGHSVNVSDLLRYLDYSKDACPCDVEYFIDTEFGTGYRVNLTKHFARNNGGMQVDLTNEQIETIKNAIEYAKTIE